MCQEKTGESVLNVSQERNKVGLGEIYAEEFLKQSANFDANAAKRKTETNDMITHFQKVLVPSMCTLYIIISHCISLTVAGVSPIRCAIPLPVHPQTRW